VTFHSTEGRKSRETVGLAWTYYHTDVTYVANSWGITP